MAPPHSHDAGLPSKCYVSCVVLFCFVACVPSVRYAREQRCARFHFSINPCTTKWVCPVWRTRRLLVPFLLKESEFTTLPIYIPLCAGSLRSVPGPPFGVAGAWGRLTPMLQIIQAVLRDPSDPTHLSLARAPGCAPPPPAGPNPPRNEPCLKTEAKTTWTPEDTSVLSSAFWSFFFSFGCICFLKKLKMIIF